MRCDKLAQVRILSKMIDLVFGMGASFDQFYTV